ncbi:MAG: hypothetical protein DME53_11040 [Verrucomicrobia bacterium]|nr:MAG: hypothetical protein DME53_11040 [Verrucomicrobiota bacterium]
MYGFALRTFLGRRQYHLHCDVWRLTRQRNDLIHCDAGSDRCITQTGFANRFFHATGAQLSDVTQDSNDALFSCAYLRGFSMLHRPDRFSRDVTPFANFV